MTGLLERDAQVAALERRLAAARRGEGGAVLVEGPPGTGKTVLLRRLREAAAAGGFLVLPAVGGELEREFPFGVVRQLLEPRLMGADAAERARLLGGAAARAAPVVGGGPAATEPTADASFATLHGLYWLVAALAETAPVLLVVDDAHWADAPSLRFLEFLARRAGESRVLVAAGLRPAEPGAEQAVLDAIAEGPAAEVLRPAPLSADGVRALVTETLADAGEDVVDAAVRSTGGNPLLVRELVRELAATGASTAAAVDAAVPSSVARAADRRLGRLDPTAQATGRALAVLGDGTPVDLLAAATGLAAADVHRGLDVLAAADLVEGVPPRYAHPLLRAAVAASMPPTAAEALHHAAARALRDDPDETGRLVVHLLAAGPLGEPWVAGRLRASAARAAASGAHDAAVRQLLRARAELGAGADPAELAGVDLELAQAAVSGGDPSAREHLHRAMAADDAQVAAEAGILGISIALVQEPEAVDAVVERVTAALAATPPEATERRAALEIALLSCLSLSIADAPRRVARLDALADDPDPGVRSYRAFHLLAQGAGAEEVAAVAQEALAGRPLLRLANVEQPVPLWAIESLIQVDGAATADAAIADGEATARRSSSRHARAMMQIGRADWCLAFGDLQRAQDAAEQARAAFTELGIHLTGMAVWSAQLEALVLRGRLAEAEAVAAGIPGPAGDPPFGIGNLWLARARLHLAQGRAAEALADLDAVDAWRVAFRWRRWARGFDEPLRCSAMVLSGDRDGGARWGRERADAAREAGMHRLEGELRLAAAAGATGKDAAALLLEAADAAARVPAPLLEARVALEQGAALRRAGSRVEARPFLVRARELATGVAADALAERATEELVLAGGRPRRVATTGVDALTPAERRVAEHAAGGLTNREIAETLFVTRKTVETTLGHAYAKLGIRSRAQLTGVLGDVAGTGAAA